MPLKTHTNEMVHGKRVRVWFEAKDDSPEAEAAMWEELAAYRRGLKVDQARKVTKQSFRQRKAKSHA